MEKCVIYRLTPEADKSRKRAGETELDYRGNKCTAVVPHGTGTSAKTYSGTV